MTSSDGRTWLSVLGLLLLAATNHTARASSLAVGFADASLSRPDGQPWDGAAGISFADDGRMFVWERSGRVWLIADASAHAKPLVDLSDEVSTIGALGLTGFALDPQFAHNGYLYLFYAVNPEHLANCASPASGAVACGASYRPGRHASSGATIARLVRYQLVRPAGAQDFSTATTVNYASRRVLLGETPNAGGAPAGCVVTDTAAGPGGLAFGNDGTLFAGCGDGASVSSQDSGSNPNTQYQQALASGLMTPAENVGAFRAQLVESLSGKILRLDAATGDGLPSNPFYDAMAPRTARSRVWVLGLHNPQHLTVRPGTGGAYARPGTLYIGESGDSTWESLAVARDGRMNFGWPLYEGIGNETTGYAALPAFNLYALNPLFPSACEQRYFRFRDLISPDPMHALWPNPCARWLEIPAVDDVFIRDRPALDWLHGGADARWAAFGNSGEPLALTLATSAPNGALVTGSLFGGTVSIGGVWYQGSNFPAPFRNVYYHADSGGEWIKAFVFDANDNPVAVRDFLSNGGPIRALGVDPRMGDLYYISGLSGSEVHKLTYSPTSLETATPSAPAAQSLTTQLDQGPSATAAPIAASSTATTRKVLAASGLAPALTTASWSSGDIGAVTAAGSYTLSGSTYTVNGSGSDIWNAADAFQFVSQPLTGDGSITARVVSQTNTNVWAKAGVMFRETLTPGSTNAFAALTPGAGVVYQVRPSTGAASLDVTSGPIVTAPYWVRMVRAGNLFTAYYSADGNTWTSLGQYTITMASQAYVGLAVCSHANGTLGTAVFDNVTVVAATPPVPDTQAPTVPTGLAVTNLAATSLTLNWSAATDLPNPGGSGVGGYYVYRNGSTTPIATVTSGTSFTNSGLAATTTYSYQVAAFDKAIPANVSALSTALSVTTQTAVAASWSSGDIGAVTAAGSYTLSGSTYTVNGSGSDIWNAADAFQFVSQPLTGDGSITARVVSQTNTNVWAKAGVMFRETLTPGSTNAFAALTPGAGVVYQVRPSTGAASLDVTSGPIVTAPYWVRMVRAGNLFTAYYSADGNTWTSLGQYTITMASQAYVGLAVCSHANGTLGTAVFDNVTVVAATPPVPDTQAPTVPTGLAVTNLAATSLTLNWSAATDLPNPGGSGVGGYYVYRNGSTTPIATVTSGTSFTNSGLAATTTYSYQVAAFDKAIPANVSALSTALSVTTQTAVAASWSSGDIGAVTAAGSYTLSGSTYTVNGSGSDIWNAADAFQFVSQPLTGDGSITARVVSQTNTNVWAKAGVMFRETLTPGSTNAFAALTPGAGVVYQVRPSTGAASLDVTSGPIVTAPYWVRMVRAGNLFTAYYSADGNTWTSLGQYTITMASQAYVGLAVCSHANGTLGTAVFDNVTVVAATPPVPDTQAPTVPTGLAVTNLAATSLTLNWSAATDLPNPGGSGVGGYYVYRNGSTTPIATVTSGTSFTNSGLAATTTYSYQVAAFDKAIPANVSALSTALSVTTQTAVAASWSSGDIGAVTAAGSYTLSGSTYTVNGSGSDIWNAADAFQFVSQPLTGDGSITARVVSQTNTNVWAKAGVMFRETLTPGSTNAFAALTPGAGVVYQVRPSTGAASLDVTSGPIVTAPYWVRMVRAGNLFTAYYSADGNTWTSLGQYTITMASQAYVGLAVCSHANGTLGTAVFDNVTIAGTTGPTLTVTPHVAAITKSQSQQFTATVSGGATWTVRRRRRRQQYGRYDHC